MKLPTSKKILREDLKGAPPWINPLIDVINSFMEAVYLALNRNISFGDNIQSQIVTLTYKSGTTDTQFISNLRVRAQGLLVLQAVEKDTFEPAPGPVYVPWVESSGTVNLGLVTGLDANKTYILRLLLI